MKIKKEKLFYKIQAEKGCYIRTKGDIYKPEVKNENGDITPEELPSVSETLYLPISLTEENILNTYEELPQETYPWK